MLAVMRRLKYYVANSLDGYIARTDTTVDWLFTDQDYGMSAFFASVDVAVMGRKTWEKIEELTPGSGFRPHIERFVFSRSRPAGSHEKTNFISGDIGEWLWTIRQQPGKDIWLVGGGEMVQAFLAQRLVDEIELTIHPRLLGAGIPLFSVPYPETELELAGCKEYNTGLVQVVYRVKR
jgi:dihydrofolate reductase